MASSSSGNAIFISSSKTKVLIDAGLTGKAIESRLADISESAEQLSAIVISHEHRDHIKGAGILSRRYNNIPLYMNPATYHEGGVILGKISEVRYFQTGEIFEIDDLTFQTFSLPHVAADPVGFLIYHEGNKISIVTDLGYATKLVKERIKGSKILVLESNHDEEMLKLGPYPWPIKQQIGGEMGHLSNTQSSALLKDSLHEGLEWVILAHLSKVNNEPEKATSAAREVLRDTSVHLEIGQQENISSIISI